MEVNKILGKGQRVSSGEQSCLGFCCHPMMSVVAVAEVVSFDS